MLTSMVFVGAFGLLCMTWLFPLIAIVLSRIGFRNAGSDAREGINVPKEQVPIGRIDILIPAHNEEDVIGETLSSITLSLASANEVAAAPIRFTIRVAADRCTDKTVEIARSFGANVLELTPQADQRFRGKWDVLKSLIQASAEDLGGPDWIILADAGVVWPDGFIAQLVPFFHIVDVLGVAPTYRNPEGGVIERLLWGLERSFKSLESKAGGPVSIHGATVAYRFPELKRAIERLGTRMWLNDDVAVPLALRIDNPEMRIAYLPELGVSDHPRPKIQAERRREFGRRRRMVIGNVQWVRLLLGEAFRKNVVAGVVALRRVFRLFWAYWVALIVPLVVPPIAIIVLFIAIAFFARIRAVRRLVESFAASILAPFYIFSPRGIEEAAWR